MSTEGCTDCSCLGFDDQGDSICSCGHRWNYHRDEVASRKSSKPAPSSRTSTPSSNADFLQNIARMRGETASGEKSKQYEIPVKTKKPSYTQASAETKKGRTSTSASSGAKPSRNPVKKRGKGMQGGEPSLPSSVADTEPIACGGVVAIPFGAEYIVYRTEGKPVWGTRLQVPVKYGDDYERLDRHVTISQNFPDAEELSVLAAFGLVKSDGMQMLDRADPASSLYDLFQRKIVEASLRPPSHKLRNLPQLVLDEIAALPEFFLLKKTYSTLTFHTSEINAHTVKQALSSGGKEGVQRILYIGLRRRLPLFDNDGSGSEDEQEEDSPFNELSAASNLADAENDDDVHYHTAFRGKRGVLQNFDGDAIDSDGSHGGTEPTGAESDDADINEAADADDLIEINATDFHSGPTASGSGGGGSSVSGTPAPKRSYKSDSDEQATDTETALKIVSPRRVRIAKKSKGGLTKTMSMLSVTSSDFDKGVGGSSTPMSAPPQQQSVHAQRAATQRVISAMFDD